VFEFYGEFKSLIDEFEMHQPTLLMRRHWGYRQDLIISKFLSGLSPLLRSQVQGQILKGDNIPMLIATFF